MSKEYWKVIDIPTLNDESSDFFQLFEIWNQINDYFERVRFSFSGCHFLRPNAVAFLGGLARLIELQLGDVIFDWDTLKNKAVMTNLCQNGFAGTFNHPSKGWDGNSIPYREDKLHELSNMNEIMDYLTHKWIGKGWIHVSERLRDAIAGRMWEIYSNALEHSDSTVGVYSCGQYFKRQNELLLSVVDFGQGIPAKIRAFVSSDPRAQNLPANACLRWAFQRGNSTCSQGIARGLGFDLLKEFVQLNQGKLEIYSNDGYVIVDKDSERYENCDISFTGTVVHITLHCDENLYQFRDETE